MFFISSFHLIDMLETDSGFDLVKSLQRINYNNNHVYYSNYLNSLKVN